MLTGAYAVMWLAGLFPLAHAWWAQRATTLIYSVTWAVIAWSGWAWTLWMRDTGSVEPARHVAICLTAAAGITVLGARRPHAMAWNFFVTIPLISVTLLPLVQSRVLGTDVADPPWVVFLAGTVGMGLLNYLPTRFAPAVLLMTLAVGGELAAHFGARFVEGMGAFFDMLVLLSPWAAWLCRRKTADSVFDQVWLEFRDSFGLVWSQRVREQFNHAASHAGWPVHLTWRGLHREHGGTAISPDDQSAMLSTLRAALHRFLGPDRGD